MSLKNCTYRGYTILLYLHHTVVEKDGEVVHSCFSYFGAKDWIDQQLDEVN